MVLLSAPVIISAVAFLAMVGVVGALAWRERSKYLDEKRATDEGTPPDAAPGEAPENEA